MAYCAWSGGRRTRREYIHRKGHTAADDGIVDVSGGGHFERGYSEGSPRVERLGNSAVAADARGSETSKHQKHDNEVACPVAKDTRTPSERQDEKQQDSQRSAPSGARP